VVPVVVLSVFALTTVGVYLLLHRSLLRVALGLGVLSHAVNLVLLSAGGWGSRVPIVTEGVRAADVSDPVPQAFVLTAIVISMAITLYLLAGMAVRARRGGGGEITLAPESDAGRAPAQVAAELAPEGAPDRSAAELAPERAP
jgi:multicomponent Na+:H+ antiporter subunit C